MARTTKVSVNLPNETLEVLRELAKSLGISMTEVLRQSILSEKFLRDETRRGNKILVVDDDGQTKEVVLR